MKNSHSKALKAKKESRSIPMTNHFKKISSEGHNPFSMVTHINGKRIK